MRHDRIAIIFRTAEAPGRTLDEIFLERNFAFLVIEVKFNVVEVLGTDLGSVAAFYQRVVPPSTRISDAVTQDDSSEAR